MGLWSNYEADEDEWYWFWRLYAGTVAGSLLVFFWGIGVSVVPDAHLVHVVGPALGIAAWCGYLIWREDIVWRRRLAIVCLAVVLLGLAIGAIRTVTIG